MARKRHAEQLSLLGTKPSGPEDFGQWFTSQDFPVFRSRPERWSKRTGDGTVWVTIEPEPGNPYCRLQSGGPGARADVPWSELRSKVEARRAELWRAGYKLEYVTGALEHPESAPERLSTVPMKSGAVDWAAMEAEAKRRFGPTARLGYSKSRPDLDRWRPVGYVAGMYPILLPKE